MTLLGPETAYSSLKMLEEVLAIKAGAALKMLEEVLAINASRT